MDYKSSWFPAYFRIHSILMRIYRKTEIGRRRWKWVGHTLRKGKNSITRQALQWNPQGSRGRGRPRETWRRCMEREMKDVGMTWVALSKKAQDRDVWPIP